MGQVNVNGSAQGGNATSIASNSLTSSLLNTANGITAYAHQRVDAVDAFVNNLTNSILTLVAPSITPQFPTVDAAPALASSQAPTVVTPTWSAPGLPAAFSQTLDISSLGVEPFDDNPPTLVFGVAPGAFTEPLPETPGVNLIYDYPDLAVDLPSAPSLLGINTITFSGADIPNFTDLPPDAVNLVAPGVVQYTPGAQYTSALLTELQAKLSDTLTNGSDGLGGPAEKAIWDRGREREAYSQRDAILKLDQMEALGFPFPPGIWLSARQQIITEAMANERGYNREATAKSAELALDFVKSALSTATQLESRLIDYNNAVEQRVFETCRYATEAGISIYNAKVQAYAQMVEVYKVKVQAYTARVQGELAKVEVYKAQVEAERLKVDMNTALVNQYRAMIDAAMTNVQIYRAELEGIQLKAGIEKTKIELFGSLVQAYGTKVNAYSAQVEAYKASLQAEQVKEQVYATQVQAFAAKVDAASKLVSNQVQVFQAQVNAKLAEYEGFKASVAGESARIEALVRSQGLTVDVFRASAAADSSYNDVLTKRWQVVLDQNERVAEIGIQAAKSNADLYVSTRGLVLEAAKASATVSAQIAAAGLNAVNYSGSVSSSESLGLSASVSTSASASTSSSSGTSTSYNYNYSV